MLHEIVFIALSILAGFARGIHEGMVMVMPWDSMWVDYSFPGVRSHRWFRRYHMVSVARSNLMMALGAALWEWWNVVPALTLAGSLLLLWEATEVGNSLARQGRLIYELTDEPHEHVNFADILSVDVANSMVWLIHGIRLVVGVTLILMGGFA